MWKSSARPYRRMRVSLICVFCASCPYFIPLSSRQDSRVDWSALCFVLGRTIAITVLEETPWFSLQRPWWLEFETRDLPLPYVMFNITILWSIDDLLLSQTQIITCVFIFKCKPFTFFVKKKKDVSFLLKCIDWDFFFFLCSTTRGHNDIVFF